MIPIVVPKAVSTTYSKNEKLPKTKKHCPQVKIQVKMWQNIFEFSRKFAKISPQKGYLGLICNQNFHFSDLCKIWHTKKKRAGRESFSLFSRNT
jgi:hypothetical protein